jgi:hypothetical protein
MKPSPTSSSPVIHYCSFTILVRRPLGKSPRKESQRGDPEAQGDRTWDRAVSDQMLKKQKISLTIDVVVKFYLCLSSSSSISASRRWALHRIPISSFVPLIHASRVSHGLITLHQFCFLCAKSWWTSPSSYIDAAVPIGNSCHVAVVRTSSGFPSAVLPRLIVDFLAKLSIISHAKLHVQHGEQIFLLAFPSLIAPGRVTYSHACMSLRMWVTLHSFARLFYCLSGLMTSCLHRAWAMMICLSQITCTNAPLACNVIISYLFLVCSHAMHVCRPSYSISITLFLTSISYLVQYQFQRFLCSHICRIILYPLAHPIKAFPYSWLVYCFKFRLFDC